MAEISKQALKVVNNTNFPNNNSGEISPSDLRSFNVDMIDSLVDELSYNADSASWNSSISALNTFTSSQQPSFAALNAFTASASQSIQALNSFTSSADSRLDSLEAETAALESFTSSINQIQDRGVVKGTSTRLNFGGGAFVTASIVPNVNGAIADITINSDTTKTDTGSFNAYTASTNARINSLEAFTASLDTNYASQAEFNAYTASNDSKVN
jgi:prefoldin subunit 5